MDARGQQTECLADRRWLPAAPMREATVDLEADIERHDEAGQSGQGLAEYALILALIAIVAIVALLFLGTAISTILFNIGQQM
jgi:Flp pilus assembly pilin Flp